MATSEKIQLKGAAQYKKDLQQIVAQSKALASEMNLVKSSFDKSTTAEQKNEAITSQLNKQIENQKRYVEKLTQAYEAEVAASGEQSTAALKAKDALNKGQTVLNQLEAENRELAAAENQETAAAQSNEAAHSKLNGVLKAAGAAVAAVAAAAAAAAKAIWDATNASGKWADELLTISAQTDVSTDTLQKWDYAARFIDTDTETITKALAKVTVQQKNAIKTGNDYVTMLDGQVISLKNANGEYKTSEEVFYEMIDALGKIEDTTVRDAAAQDLFGKSFQELKPLIDAGSEGLKKYGDEAEAMGLILGDDAVKQLGAFDDQMQKLQATMEVAGREMSLSFLPATQRIAESLTELATTVTTALADGFQEADVDTVLTALFEKLSEGLTDLSAMMPGIAAFISGLVVKLVEFVTQNLPMIAEVSMQIILALVNGLSANLPTLIPAVVECALTVARTLTEPSNLQAIINAGNQLILAVIQGVIAALPVIVSQMASAGKSMVEGLWNGIKDKADWIKAQIRSWTDNVISWFKNFLKIGSPSKVMADEIGVNMARGIAVGLTDGMSYVKSALGMTNGLINSAFSFGGAGAGGVTVYIDGIKYNTDEYIDGSITNFVENMVRRGQMYGR